MIFFKNGASGRTRTACLLLRRKSLYPDELRLHCDFYKIKCDKLQDIFIGAISQIITLITKTLARFLFLLRKNGGTTSLNTTCALRSPHSFAYAYRHTFVCLSFVVKLTLVRSHPVGIRQQKNLHKGGLFYWRARRDSNSQPSDP